MDDIEQMDPLVEARLMADAVASSLPKSIPIHALPMQSKIPFKVFSLRETLLHRASALASPAVTLLEAGNVVSGVLLTRAVMETVAILADLQAKLDAFVKTPDVGAMDTFLMKGMFANRQEKGGIKDEFYTSSIMSSIDRLDKKFNGFREMYDTLSEYSHPNYSGVFGAFGTVDQEKFMLELGPKKDESSVSVGANALASTMNILVHYYDEMPALMVALNRHFEPSWVENS